MAASWDLRAGDDITTGYVALRVLGGGHNYEVYLAQDERRLALVVVKLLRPDRIDNDQDRSALAREAMVLEQLAHPVIVRSFGAELEAERPHIVLEHLEGPHLSRLIRGQGPLALEQVVPLAVQLFSALHYMSREGFVHLDIKPRNIIMSGPPRLIDLSIARSVEAAKRITSPLGTDAFMAPEQCIPARADIGTPADVWAVGATLYQAMTGDLPFSRPENFNPDDPSERWPQLDGDPPALSKDVPAELRAVVDECLRRDPNERPAPVEAVGRLEPLVRALPARPVLRRLRPRLAPRRK